MLKKPKNTFDFKHKASKYSSGPPVVIASFSKATQTSMDREIAKIIEKFGRVRMKYIPKKLPAAAVQMVRPFSITRVLFHSKISYFFFSPI